MPVAQRHLPKNREAANQGFTPPGAGSRFSSFGLADQGAGRFFGCTILELDAGGLLR